MNNILISFIIPYHNEPTVMLRQCIESIMSLALSDGEREILLIDDGSTVSPMPELGALGNAISYVHQNNEGPSSARNNGIDRAKGRYIQFVDSDDFLFADAYDDIISCIRQSDTDMLMYRFSTNEAHQRICDMKSTKCWSGDDFLCHNNLRAACCTYIFKRELLGTMRFKKGIFLEDSLFTPLLILRAKNLINSRTEAYYYRQHGGTTTSNRNESHITRRLDDTLTVILELQKESCLMQGTKKRAIQRCIDQQVMGYIYVIFTLTRSIREVYARTRLLKSHGLYPLPIKPYTLKYWLFALFFRF